MKTKLARTFIVACLLALGTNFAPSAQGQSMSMSTGISDPTSIFRPRFTQPDFDRIADVLNLSGDERAAAKDLHAGYTRSLELRQTELIEQQLQVVDMGNLLQDMRVASAKEQAALRKQWEEEAKKSEDSFLNDLKSLVASKDTARWEVAMRERRRMKERGKGTLLAEAADVVQVTTNTLPGAAMDASVREALEAYCVDIDRVYISRIAAAKAYNDPDRDTASKGERWDELWRVRIALRELNERYAQRVAALLAPADAENFSRAFFAAAYAGLLAPTPTAEMLRDAPNLAGLSEDTRARIEADLASYETQVYALAQRGLALQKERETAYKPDFRGGGDADGTSSSTMEHLRIDPESPLGKLRTERVKLDAAARTKLLGVLNADQRVELLKDRSMQVRVDNRDVPSRWFGNEDDD